MRKFQISSDREIKMSKTTGSRRPNLEELTTRKNRLSVNETAMGYLEAMGISQATISSHDLGLVHQEDTCSKKGFKSALCFPRRSLSGPTNRFIHIEVPGVTTNAPRWNWSRGEALSHFGYFEKVDCPVIVVHLRDFHLMCSIIGEVSRSDFQVVSTSHEGIPREWKKVDFWDQWTAVFSALPAIDKSLTAQIRQWSSQPVIRVALPDNIKNLKDLAILPHRSKECLKNLPVTG